VYTYAKTKQSEFFWTGMIEFYHEMFLTICVGFGFNLGYMTFENASNGFNTLVCVLVTVNAVSVAFVHCIILYIQLRKATQEAED